MLSRPVCRLLEEEEEVDKNLYHAQAKLNLPPLEIHVKIDYCVVKMKFVAGATVPLMSETIF